MIKKTLGSKTIIQDNWVFKNSSSILNIENGFKIALIDGNWGEPKNLDIKASKGFPKKLYAQQIREGIEYAQSDNGICDLALLYIKKPSQK